MSQRIAGVINQPTNGINDLVVAVPEGKFTRIQVVFERSSFENITTDKDGMIEIELFRQEDMELIGSASWAGGRIEGGGVRPGRRMLWSHAYWPLPDSTKNILVRTKAIRPFHLKLDVDFF